MTSLKRFACMLAVTFGCFALPINSNAQKSSAQQAGPSAPQSPAPVVTATASARGVRYASLGEVYQTRLQVFSPSGAQAFDSGLRLGNLIDWNLRGQQGQHLPDGSYLFLLTVTDFSGRLTQKYGTAVLEEGQVFLQQASREDLSEAQASALEIGRQTTATFGLIDRIGAAGLSRAAVSAGEDGDRASGKVLTSGTTPVAAETPTPTATGTGTQGRLAKWTDNAGALGDSVVTELSNNIGIGTTTPNSKLHVVGALELGATSGAGVNPTIINPNNIANFSLVRFYPASGTNVNTSFTVVPRGTGQPNNRAQFSVTNTDAIADPSNVEFAALRARGLDFVFGTGKSGTGVIRPLMFSAGYLTDNATNNNQLVLATNGNVGVGTATPASKLTVTGGDIRIGTAGRGIKFADGTTQTTAPTGDITGVTAGTGLTGGGTSGAVTLGIGDGGVDTTQLADGAVTSPKLALPLSLTATVNGAPLVDVFNNTPLGALSLGTGISSAGGHGIKAISLDPKGYGAWAFGSDGSTSINSGIGGDAIRANAGDGENISGGNGSAGGRGLIAFGGRGASPDGSAHDGGAGGAGVHGVGGIGGSGLGGDGGAGVHGEGGKGSGTNLHGPGVKGIGGSANDGSPGGAGVIGEGGAASGAGVVGTGGSPNGTGVRGVGSGTGAGVQGTTANGIGVHGITTGSGKAGKFDGPVEVTGILDVDDSGVRFPANIHGGSGDQARIYVEPAESTGDATDLIIQNENDGPGEHQDNIYLKAAKVFVQPNAGSGYAGGGQLHVSGGCSGCTVAPSDRNLKTNFSAVDARSVLDRVARLPIQTWSYEEDSKKALHIGPMAQDFRAAFQLGRDDKHIDLIDANGVTMASVQALYQMMLEKDRQLERQGSQIEALTRTVKEQQAQLNQVKRSIRRKRAAKR